MKFFVSISAKREDFASTAVTPNLKIISRSGYVPSLEILSLSFFKLLHKSNGLRALQSIAMSSIIRRKIFLNPCWLFLAYSFCRGGN